MTTTPASPAAPAPATKPARPLRVDDLSLDLRLGERTVTAVDGVTFEVEPGTTLGVVGESGSGKSLTALAMARMLPRAARVTRGSVRHGDDELLTLSEREFTRRRGDDIGMVFQDPLAYLNPLMTVGDQIAEALRLHGTPRDRVGERVLELLRLVGVQDAERRRNAYPHEFSGGMRQRVVIAIAIANDPAVLLADEPTTALDVTVQASILRLLRRLQDELGTTIVLITHDIGVVEEVCDTVVVMYAGRVVERGPVDRVLARPQHPYTRDLMRSSPRLDVPLRHRLPAIPGQPPDLLARPGGCSFHPRCPLVRDRCRTEEPPLTGREPGRWAACWADADEVAGARSEAGADAVVRPAPADAPLLEVTDVTVGYPRAGAWWRRSNRVAVVEGVGLRAYRGRALGLVGESGSGKSTLAKAVLGLLPVMSGTVAIDGIRWEETDRRGRRALRRKVQLVFQDPYQSLNPRQTVRELLTEPLVVHAMVPAERRATRVGELTELVGLPASLLDRYPYQLSGGQRQRVGIARALSLEPALLVADEPVSALDVSVQAQIVNLLADLRDELGLGFLVIAHDLSVVRHLCDDVAVMEVGRIVEQGPTARIFDAPQHPYTRRLLAASPGSPWSGPAAVSGEGRA